MNRQMINPLDSEDYERTKSYLLSIRKDLEWREMPDLERLIEKYESRKFISRFFSIFSISDSLDRYEIAKRVLHCRK